MTTRHTTSLCARENPQLLFPWKGTQLRQSRLFELFSEDETWDPYENPDKPRVPGAQALTFIVDITVIFSYESVWNITPIYKVLL